MAKFIEVLAPARVETKKWASFKQRKMLAFVRRGCSVVWAPDDSRRVVVLRPSSTFTDETSIEADIHISGEKSMFGIDDGRIVGLTITSRRVTDEETGGGDFKVLFDYPDSMSRDKLDKYPLAMALYKDVIELLN